MSAIIATFFLVFGKAWQQQNVIHRQFAMAAVTSYFLALCEVAVLLIIVDKGWSAVLWVGTGGALGVTCSMYLHRRFTNAT